MPTIPEVVAMILRDCAYWAPEVRASKLLPYLDAYGPPLAEALMALDAKQRESCGIDKIRAA